MVSATTTFHPSSSKIRMLSSDASLAMQTRSFFVPVSRMDCPSTRTPSRNESPYSSVVYASSVLGRRVFQVSPTWSFPSRPLSASYEATSHPMPTHAARNRNTMRHVKRTYAIVQVDARASTCASTKHVHRTTLRCHPGQVRSGQVRSKKGSFFSKPGPRTAPMCRFGAPRPTHRRTRTTDGELSRAKERKKTLEASAAKGKGRCVPTCAGRTPRPRNVLVPNEEEVKTTTLDTTVCWTFETRGKPRPATNFISNAYQRKYNLASSSNVVTRPDGLHGVHSFYHSTCVLFHTHACIITACNSSQYA